MLDRATPDIGSGGSVSLVDAAKDLLEISLKELSDHAIMCPFCGGFRIGEWGESRPDTAVACDGYDHYPECIWPNRQKIVRVLETAEALALAWECTSYPEHWARMKVAHDAYREVVPPNEQPA